MMVATLVQKRKAVADSNTAVTWDRLFSDPLKTQKTRGLYFYRLALKRIKPGETICDAGCGYTFYLRELMRRCGRKGGFIGIDFSTVALTKSAMIAQGYRHVQLLLGDVRALPLSNDSVDRSFCAETLPYLLEDVERGLQELARVSRQEVVFSLPTRGQFEIKGTGNEFRGNLVIEHQPGAKPPRRVFEREEILQLVKSVGSLHVELIQPFPYMDLIDTRSSGGRWPWYLPPRETIALYYVVARKK